MTLHARTRRATTAAALTVLLTVGVMSATVNAQELTADQRKAIDAIGARWKPEGSPGISVAIVRGGEVTFAKGYGSAQLEYGIAIGPDSVFHVASVSKQFTAFALVLLARDGKLSLDDDVRKYVPWLHDFGQTITIRHLLNHTSGLRDQWELLAISGYSLQDVLGQEHILRILRGQRELNFAPGSEYLYSNMGYTLAAYIVEVVAGRPFPQFCAERIFAPLEMTRTHFHLDHERIVPDRAYSYRRAGGGWKKGALNYANVGATSLFTTATDLARWLDNLRSARVGGGESIRELLRRAKVGDKEHRYALGISHGTFEGHASVGHGGADAGYRSDVLWFPGVELGIVVLANAADAQPARVARQIARVVLGLEAPADRPRTRPRADDAREEVAVTATDRHRIAGFYGRADEPRVAVRREEDGHLSVEIAGRGRARLRASSPQEYFVREAPVIFRFDLPDASGAATAVTVVEGERSNRAERVTSIERKMEMHGFSGRYYCPELEVFYEIRIENGGLVARQRRHGDIPLRIAGSDRLASRRWFLRNLRFERRGARPTGFRLSGSRVRNLWFARLGEVTSDSPSAEWFANGPLPRLRIELDQAAEYSLRQEPRRYVHATLTEEGAPPLAVGVKLKGSAGSFRDLDDKPGLTIDVDRVDERRRFHGLVKFHLNNAVQDDTYMQEFLAYEAFRAVGLPAPRVTHARVWLNGRDLGLYVLKESYDRRFLERSFPHDFEGNLYDGGVNGEVGDELDRDEGSGPTDWADLHALNAACDMGPGPERRTAIAAHLDVDQFLSFMAAELMIGHWDGYTLNPNNYRIYFGRESPRGVFIIHGADQTFQDPHASTIARPRGRVARKVLEEAEWRAALRGRIKALLPVFSPADGLVERLRAKAARLMPVVEQTMAHEFARKLAERHKDLENRLRERARFLVAESTRRQPEVFDPDADGGALGDLPWTRRTDCSDVRMEGREEEFLIRAGTCGHCVGSFRTEILLDPGRYVFRAVMTTNGVVSPPDVRNTGAGIRISGGRRDEVVTGSVDEREVAYEIDVGEDEARVILVLELRSASSGSVVFPRKGLRLERR